MKKVFILLAVAFTITVNPMKNVHACGNNVVYASDSVWNVDKGNVSMPKADVIVTKFRILNGVTQYRRWNETQNCWVDQDWINLN